MDIGYFVHDLADAAVDRRVRMLTLGGATVTRVGFRRRSEPPGAGKGSQAVDLGRTRDGALGQRTLSVATAFSRMGEIGPHVRGADVILARNLEMLLLAARARSRFAPAARLVYECLDIHRLLLSNDPGGRLLRFIETRLWKSVDLLLTSSPAFVRNYFTPRDFPAPIMLVENKVLVDERGTAPRFRRPAGPPWRIGWFGMIRCRKSLAMLGELARAADGAVEVVVRGQPSDAVFPNFDAAIADLRHVSYAGPYHNPEDLPDIYADVHFCWAIDYFEHAQNSRWLLPNRMYEGSLYGAVPIALAEVETGRWLAERRAGVLLSGAVERQLVDFFRQLEIADYLRLATGLEAVPRADLMSDRSDCRALVDALCAI
jgi:succinoglycan biosynthesis protein ExoL